MLEFRNIQLSDKEWIDKSLEMSDFRGCEYSFANNIAWRRLGNAKIADLKIFISVRLFLKKRLLSFFLPEKEITESFFTSSMNSHHQWTNLLLSNL